MTEIVISKNEEGFKLRKLCMNYLKYAPQSFIYKMLRKKNIVLNDKKATGNEVLKAGDSVKFYMKDETIANFRFSSGEKNADSLETKDKSLGINKDHPNIKLDVIYENQDMIFVNKPVGILSQKSDNKDYSINEAIIDHLLEKGDIDDKSLTTFKPSVCNRLDRNTSGIILASKTAKGAQYLSESIKNGNLDKYYLTVCAGEFNKAGDHIAYLIKDSVENKVKIISEKDINKPEYNIKKYSKPVKIKTGIELIDYNDDLDISLLKIRLYTGKSHQIRAHLSYLGYPVIGDTKYGNKVINAVFNRKYKVRSQLLHAFEIHFKDDGSSYTAQPPKIFYELFSL